MDINLKLLAVGLVIGLLSGMLGIGGGVLVIPALVILFGFDQKLAVGTSLGMLLPPIGIFAFWTYYRAGAVSVPASALLAGGFAVGAFLGGLLATQPWMPETFLRRFFGFFMLYVAGNVLFRTDAYRWAVIKTATLMGVFAGAYLVTGGVARRWNRELGDTLPVLKTYRTALNMPSAPDYEI